MRNRQKSAGNQLSHKYIFTIYVLCVAHATLVCLQRVRGAVRMLASLTIMVVVQIGKQCVQLIAQGS